MDFKDRKLNSTKLLKLFSIVLLLIFTYSSGAQENTIPAFPGAGGFGKYTEGGRGGRVIYVTTLKDNTQAGSLRYAINQSGPRIVMFKISGTIQLKSSLKIKNDNITIAGQTAPGDGITLRDYPVTVDADNVIIRYLRFRMGDVTAQEADALGGRYHKNIIVDHCSMSWSTDECVSFYGNENFTLQWCILSESLRVSVHSKGTHGYGGIWGGEKASFHHNLLAHHDSRNPRFCGSRYSNRHEFEMVDFRNNVIYNWGSNSAYAGEGGRYNMVNNYYLAGPATKSGVKDRIIQPWADEGKNSQPAGIYGTFFIEGNYVSASAAVTSDNWAGVDMSSTFGTYAPGITKSDLVSETEYDAGEVITHTAEQSYSKVLDYAGASLAYDSVDIRIIHETATETVTFTDGGNGSKNGLTDTQEAVGGWPFLASAEAPSDTDEDGMPDDWENTNGLNANDPSDAQLKSLDDVYPNLEVYLNSLVADITAQQDEDGIHTSIQEIDKVDKKEENIFIRYNNTSRQLMVKHNQAIDEIKFYSITGKLMKLVTTNQNDINIDVAGLNNSIYIVRIKNTAQQIFTKKIGLF